jgi:hypothetical protein
MTLTEIQQQTKFIQTVNGDVAEVILPYTDYQELLAIKANVDATRPEGEECTPNAETRQAIYDAQHGRNLVVCEHADDLFDKLGI